MYHNNKHMNTIEVKIHKNCKNCVHCDVCKYREAMVNFANKSLMYNMFDSSEDNTILETFENNINACKYYKVLDIDRLKQMYVMYNYQFAKIIGEDIHNINKVSDGNNIIVTETGKGHKLFDVLKNVIIVFE